MATTLHGHRMRRLALMVAGSGGTSAPANETRPRLSYTSETSFDANMVIVLAVLLCALILALCLNSVVRWALRCSRRITVDTTGDTAARMNDAGLKKSDLRQIPVVVVGSGVDIPEAECPICLGDFAGGEEVRILPKCNHGFHMTCIDFWLTSHSSCPTCRLSLPENLPDSDPPESDPAGFRPRGNSSDGRGIVSVAVEEVS